MDKCLYIFLTFLVLVVFYCFIAIVNIEINERSCIEAGYSNAATNGFVAWEIKCINPISYHQEHKLNY